MNSILGVHGSGWRRLRGCDTAAAAPDGPGLVALLALRVLAAAGALDAAGHNGDGDEVESNGCAPQDAPNNPPSSRWCQRAAVDG